MSSSVYRLFGYTQVSLPNVVWVGSASTRLSLLVNRKVQTIFSCFCLKAASSSIVVLRSSQTSRFRDVPFFCLFLFFCIQMWSREFFLSFSLLVLVPLSTGIPPLPCAPFFCLFLFLHPDVVKEILLQFLTCCVASTIPWDSSSSTSRRSSGKQYGGFLSSFPLSVRIWSVEIV